MDTGRGSEWRHVWENEETRGEGAWVWRHNVPLYGVYIMVLTHSWSGSWWRHHMIFLAHFKNELMQWRGVRRLSVCLSVCPSVCKRLRKSLLLADKWPDATKLSQDWLQVSVHPGCAQGQGQRSRDTRTSLDSWNELKLSCDDVIRSGSTMREDHYIHTV